MMVTLEAGADPALGKARVGEVLILRCRVAETGASVRCEVTGVERFKGSDKKVSAMDYLKEKNPKPITAVPKVAA